MVLVILVLLETQELMATQATPAQQALPVMLARLEIPVTPETRAIMVLVVRGAQEAMGTPVIREIRVQRASAAAAAEAAVVVFLIYNLKVNPQYHPQFKAIPVTPGTQARVAGAALRVRGGPGMQLTYLTLPATPAQLAMLESQETVVAAAMLIRVAQVAPGMLARMVMLVTLAQVPTQAARAEAAQMAIPGRQVPPELTAQLAIRGQHQALELT